MTYYQRITDTVLAARLRSAGAVLIEGAKGCGKTETVPAALTVITGNGFAHRRRDGVNVVPISALTV
ncbi:MAG: hypothetical protein LBR76_00595 [Oscillospiraceae bacterium]|jgi:MoxR-like ATPase|nr:hypothetical protein [Oscillospiraceae bacterium]